MWTSEQRARRDHEPPDCRQVDVQVTDQIATTVLGRQPQTRRHRIVVHRVLLHHVQPAPQQRGGQLVARPAKHARSNDDARQVEVVR
jgi:hypothetical protein